ncbi:MAG TPA: hypothetical protein VGM45_08550 [Gaiellaceae bacterium]
MAVRIDSALDWKIAQLGGRSLGQVLMTAGRETAKPGKTMRVGELLSTRSDKQIDDSWISVDCAACGSSNNLGSCPTETRGETFVYLCSKCGEDVIEVRHAGGGDYKTDVGKPGFAIQVPDDYKPG